MLHQLSAICVFECIYRQMVESIFSFLVDIQCSCNTFRVIYPKIEFYPFFRSLPVHSHVIELNVERWTLNIEHWIMKPNNNNITNIRSHLTLSYRISWWWLGFFHWILTLFSTLLFVIWILFPDGEQYMYIHQVLIRSPLFYVPYSFCSMILTWIILVSIF